MDATVTVTAVDEVGPNTYAVRFETPDGFSAEPGQFVKLGTTIDGESIARFYTLSSPRVTTTFEVTIGIDPTEGGDFSAFLSDIQPGVEMSMAGPYGDDHYAGDARVVILAGGPGVGPAVAIAERALDDGGEAVVIYRDDTPAHAERLEALRGDGADVHVQDTGMDLKPVVESALTGTAAETVFVYGFADFVAAAEEAITAAGGNADDANVENFG